MEERMITVVIPTYNRFECMKYFFENCFLTYTGKLFTFEIHDSSEDDRVKEYIDANIGDSPILKYFKYDPSINGDVKAMRAMTNVTTPYAYLCGDRIIPLLNEMEQILQENSFNEYLLIGGFEEYKMKRFHSLPKNTWLTYTTFADYFEIFYNPFTLWGATIVNTILLKKRGGEPLIKDKNGFSYITHVFRSLATTNGKVACFCGQLLTRSPFQMIAGWRADRRIIPVYCYEYYQAVLSLSALYTEKVKDVMYRNSDWIFHPKRILGLRAGGHITFSIVKRYHFYIRRTIRAYPLVYLSLIFPPLFLNLLRRVKHSLRAQK